MACAQAGPARFQSPGNGGGGATVTSGISGPFEATRYQAVPARTPIRAIANTANQSRLALRGRTGPPERAARSHASDSSQYRDALICSPSARTAPPGVGDILPHSRVEDRADGWRD